MEEKKNKTMLNLNVVQNNRDYKMVVADGPLKDTEITVNIYADKNNVLTKEINFSLTKESPYNEYSQYNLKGFHKMRGTSSEPFAFTEENLLKIMGKEFGEHLIELKQVDEASYQSELLDYKEYFGDIMSRDEFKNSMVEALKAAENAGLQR